MDCFCAIWDFVTLDGIIKTIELGLTAFGCYVAWRALSTWREQVIDTPKIELAREIMESFYNVVDIIKGIRRNLRFLNSEEIRKYFNQKDLTDIQCSCLEPVYEVQKNMDVFLRFEKLKNKAKVNYGNVLTEYFTDIIRIINDITDASEKLAYYVNKDKYEHIEELKRTIYQKENDEINQKLEQIIKEVEYNLKPLYASKIITWHKIKG